MAHQKASTVAAIIGYETTYGSAPAAGYTLALNSFGVVGEQAKNIPATLTGTRNPAPPFDGNVNVGGPIVIPIDSTILPYWLAAIFGDPTSTGADPYVHEYKIANVMPSFSLESAFTDLASARYNQFVGCKVASFAMNLGGDGELVATLNIVGADESLETSSFDGSPTALTLARLQNFQAAITEGGGALANATEVSLNIDFNLDTDNQVIGGAGILGSLPAGIVAASGTITTLFEDDSLLAKALASTESSLVITVTGSASSIFEIEIQELNYARHSVVYEGDQGLKVVLPFVPFYEDGAEASAVVMRVTNSVASYDLIT